MPSYVLKSKQDSAINHASLLTCCCSGCSIGPRQYVPMVEVHLMLLQREHLQLSFMSWILPCLHDPVHQVGVSLVFIISMTMHLLAISI